MTKTANNAVFCICDFPIFQLADVDNFQADICSFYFYLGFAWLTPLESLINKGRIYNYHRAFVDILSGGVDIGCTFV